MLSSIFLGGIAYGALHLHSRLIGDEQRSVIGQPDVQERQVLYVVGEKLRFEAMTEEDADRKEQERDGEGLPPMVDNELAHSIVVAAKSARASLLHGRFFFLRRAQQVVAEKRYESHGDQARSDQRAGHNDGKA